MHTSRLIQSRILCLDGGTGTELQKRGLPLGAPPEQMNLTAPKAVVDLHRAYIEAGADIITANTFGVNPLKYADPAPLIRAALACAKEARGDRDVRIALDIGPLGKLLAPLGNLSFEEAYRAFAETVRLGAEAGADLILIETVTDTYELKAAVLAAKENASLPIIATVSPDGRDKLLTGADMTAVGVLLEGLGVDAVGINCGRGPAALTEAVRTLRAATDLPLAVSPNACLPIIEDGKTVYPIGPEEFARLTAELIPLGVQMVGGCCGTTPDMIRALAGLVRNMDLPPLPSHRHTAVSSYTHAHLLGDLPTLIGERINPTGKKKLKEALRSHDLSYVEELALSQEASGAHILDVNVGLPDVDEPALLAETVCRIQAVTDLPLQIDSASPEALERAMRIYNGKPLVNSVNGKAEVMARVFPLVKRYGGVVIALTLDEQGVPDTVEGRVAIAERILGVAESYGILPHELIFDPLAMAVSADHLAAAVTLGTLRALRQKGLLCSLGVSNVSFGLPARDAVNAAFYTMALEEGLNAAILNPASEAMMSAYRAYRMLKGQDPRCSDYLAYAAGLSDEIHKTAAPTDTLKDAIRQGRAQRACELAEEMLRDCTPMAIVEEQIIPSLTECGQRFEEGKLFLPQLLSGAEAAKSAFEVLKKQMKEGGSTQNKGVLVMATVKGDIHDIGKNIVVTVMESYGYRVVDLGRDVSAEAITEAAKRECAAMVGLSALMTTTVPAMAQTVAMLRRECPSVRVAVGGAVLTEEAARQMGADVYCPDALALVRYAESQAEI